MFKHQILFLAELLIIFYGYLLVKQLISNSIKLKHGKQEKVHSGISF